MKKVLSLVTVLIFFVAFMACSKPAPVATPAPDATNSPAVNAPVTEANAPAVEAPAPKK